MEPERDSAGGAERQDVPALTPGKQTAVLHLVDGCFACIPEQLAWC